MDGLIEETVEANDCINKTTKINATAIKLIIRGNINENILKQIREQCDKLVELDIHNVTNLTIGCIDDNSYEGSLYGTQNLARVVLPGSLTQLGLKALCGCKRLVEVTLPNTLNIIAQEAFEYCEQLQTVRLPNGLREIRSGAFYGCKSLRDLRIPPGVTIIGSAAFVGCGALRLTIDPLNTAFCIAGKTLCTHDLKTVVSGFGSPVILWIPYGVETINDFSFQGCSSLQSVYFPSTLRNIGSQTFGQCVSLNKVDLPSWVEYIGPYAFFGCKSIEEIVGPIGMMCRAAFPTDAFVGCPKQIVCRDISICDCGYCFQPSKLPMHISKDHGLTCCVFCKQPYLFCESWKHFGLRCEDCGAYFCNLDDVRHMFEKCCCGAEIRSCRMQNHLKTSKEHTDIVHCSDCNVSCKKYEVGINGSHEATKCPVCKQIYCKTANTHATKKCTACATVMCALTKDEHSDTLCECGEKVPKCLIKEHKAASEAHIIKTCQKCKAEYPIYDSSKHKEYICECGEYLWPCVGNITTCKNCSTNIIFCPRRNKGCRFSVRCTNPEIKDELIKLHIEYFCLLTPIKKQYDYQYCPFRGHGCLFAIVPPTSLGQENAKKRANGPKETNDKRPSATYNDGELFASGDVSNNNFRAVSSILAINPEFGLPIYKEIASLSAKSEELSQSSTTLSEERNTLIITEEKDRRISEFMRNEMAHHLKEACKYFPIPCEFTEAGCCSYARRNCMLEHSETCPFRRTICKYCGTTVKEEHDHVVYECVDLHCVNQRKGCGFVSYDKEKKLQHEVICEYSKK